MCGSLSVRAIMRHGLFGLYRLFVNVILYDGTILGSFFSCHGLAQIAVQLIGYHVGSFTSNPHQK